MPGGWKADTKNAFTAAGRTPEQNDLFNYLQTILNWRKTKEVIHTGKLMHFIPENNMYVYFRYNDAESLQWLEKSIQEFRGCFLTDLKVAERLRHLPG